MRTALPYLSLAVLLGAASPALAVIPVSPAYVELNAGQAVVFQAEGKEAGAWLWEIKGDLDKRLIDPVSGRFSAPRVSRQTTYFVSASLRSHPGIQGFATVLVNPAPPEPTPAPERREAKADPAELRGLLEALPPALDQLCREYLDPQQSRVELAGELPFGKLPGLFDNDDVFGDPGGTGVTSAAQLHRDFSAGLGLSSINGLPAASHALIGYGCPVEFRWPRESKREPRDGQLFTWLAPYRGEDAFRHQVLEPGADRLTLAFKEQAIYGNLQSLRKQEEKWNLREFGNSLWLRGLFPVAGDPLAAPALQDGVGAAARFRAVAGLLAFDRPNRHDPRFQDARERLCAMTDPVAHVLRVVYDDGLVSTLCGRDLEPGHQDGPGPLARFNRPTFLAAAPQAAILPDGEADAFWVADSGNHSIRTVAMNGAVRTLAGSGRPGHFDGDLREAEFRHPLGLATGPDGALYVADAGNHVIRRIRGGRVDTIAGAVQQSGADDGPGGFSRFTALKGLAMDPEREVLYAVDGHAVRSLYDRGDGVFVVGTVVGSVTEPGFRSLLAGAQAMLEPCLRDPWALAWDGERLHISDRGNHALRAFRPEGEEAGSVLETLVGHPSQGVTAFGLLQDMVHAASADLGYGCLESPVGLAVQPHIVVGVPGDGRIPRMDSLLVSARGCLARVSGHRAEGQDPSLALLLQPPGILHPEALAAGADCEVTLLPQEPPDEAVQRDRDFLYTVEFLEADGSLAARFKGEGGFFQQPPVLTGRFRVKGHASVRVHLVTLEGYTLELRSTLTIH